MKGRLNRYKFAAWLRRMATLLEDGDVKQVIYLLRAMADEIEPEKK